MYESNYEKKNFNFVVSDLREKTQWWKFVYEAKFFDGTNQMKQSDTDERIC